MASRIIRFVLLVVASWTVMTFTHEMGHIVGGMCCGGTLVSADLFPWHLPYSIFEPDPKPLVTLWCGPILGVLVPLALAISIRHEWMWFIANFCVLANGAYIAAAWLSGDRYLDTPKLLERGAHPITICVFCLLTIAFGYLGFRRSCIRALTNAPGVLLPFINDSENLTLFEYREPMVLRRIGEQAKAEQPAAGDKKERAGAPFLAPELERS